MVSLTHSCFVFCWCNSRSCCYLFMLFSSRPHYTSTLIGRSPPPPGALCASASHPTLLRGTPRSRRVSDTKFNTAILAEHLILFTQPMRQGSFSQQALILRASSSTHVERDEGFLYAFLQQHTSSERSEDLSPCAIEKRSTREWRWVQFSLAGDAVRTLESNIKGRIKTMVLQSAKLLSFLTSDRWEWLLHDNL
jgi:hypothetical protein